VGAWQHRAVSAGYSGTPLVKKLGIKEEARLALLGAPDGFDATLGALPAGVEVRTRAQGTFDVVICFLTARRDLERRFPALMKALDPDGGLWIAWPKRASGVTTDVTEDTVREVALAHGLVDNKVCAVDDVWSGLRLVYRVSDRPGLRSRKAKGA
jgi:hypothetical protein